MGIPVGTPLNKIKKLKNGSRPITEVKQRRVQSVLGWVTTLEYWVPYAFYQKEVRAWLMYNVVVIPSYIVYDHITLSAPVLGVVIRP